MPIANCIRCDCEMIVDRTLAIKRLCTDCRKIRAKESNKRRYEFLKGDNKCLACGEPAYKTYTRCKSHHEDHIKTSALEKQLLASISKKIKLPIPIPIPIPTPNQNIFVLDKDLLRELTGKNKSLSYICEKLGAKSLPERAKVSEKWLILRKAYHARGGPHR